MENILVSGATGYIGSNLIKKLCSNNYNVSIIIRTSSNLKSIEEIKNQINIYYFDEDSNQLLDIVNNIKPDIVIHLASCFINEHKTEEIEKILKSNILFSTQLLEACAKSDTKYFINTGSYWQNYNGEDYNPVNLYAASKQAFMNISKYYLEVYNMRMITLKLIDTYGPNDTRPKIINLLKNISKTNEKLEMSDGEQELGLLYIDDVIKAFLIAIDEIQKISIKEHKTYIALPSEKHKLREVVDIFEEICNKKLNIEWGKRPYKSREMMKIPYYIDENILENNATTTLYEGLKQSIEVEKG